MRVVRMIGAGKDYTYKWPEGPETYDLFVEYLAVDEEGEHTVRIGFGKSEIYGKLRCRVVVWIDDHPHAEFFGADDFEKSGDLLSEIRIPDETGGLIICRYPEDPVPERYAMFHVVGMPTRVRAPGVHNAWAVVANIADHKTLIALAALRIRERWG